MTALLDPSLILAAADRADLNHRAAVEWLAGAAEPLAMHALALSEADYLLCNLLGLAAGEALMAAIDSGAIGLLQVSPADLARASALRARAAEARPTLSDAVGVVLAQRLGIARIVTFDRRAYSVLRSASRASFALEP